MNGLAPAWASLAFACGGLLLGFAGVDLAKRATPDPAHDNHEREEA